MNCYLCRLTDLEVAAVAAYPHCGAGLCFEHFEHPRLGHAGMTYGCSHQEEAERIRAHQAKPGANSEPAHERLRDLIHRG